VKFVARSTPLVQFDSLRYQQDGQQYMLKVGTPEWYAWLNEFPMFAFRGEYGSFTARKELAGNRRGGEYWKAYRTRNRKLHRAYLGKSEALTLERLNEIAFALESETVNVPGHPTRPALDVESLDNRPSNLPAHLLPLIGREQDVTALCSLLKQLDMQLLTLVGTGGVGKTSLALHVANDRLHEFPHGVYIVSLAPIYDPTLVLSTIAQTFGLRASGDRTFMDLLAEFLRSRELLLVLDNFEQVIPAAPLLTELQAHCPTLKLLVTSRESLNLRQEHVFPVLPLNLPNLKELPDFTSLSQFAAIALFVQRTQAVKSDFLLNESNAGTVAEICIRLDGLPLAIELAATRMRLLSPQQLLARLEQRLQVLTGGSRDLPTRQQTLRNTIQWSYDLLNVEEQRLFRRLAIFVGSCSIEAVESLSESITHALGEEQMNVLDACISLLDKQLIQQLQQPHGDSRLYMLETIREFALECLYSSRETGLAGEAHARYFLAYIEKSAVPVFDPKEMEWFDKLDQEQDNLRATLNWFIEKQDAELALRLSGTLVRFWGVRGYMHEARHWLEQALNMRENASMPALANALSGVGWLSMEFGDYAQAEALCKESLMLYQKLDDERGMALAYHRLGGAYSRINAAAARIALEESVSLYRKIHDRGGLAYSLMSLGTVYLNHGENSLAHLQLQEGLEQCRELGNKEGIAWSLLMLALLFLTENNLSKVTPLLEECLMLFSEIRNKGGRARALILMGEVMSKQGKYAEARLFLEEGLALLREVGSRQFIAQSLLILARTVAIQGDIPAARSYYEECLAIIKDLKVGTSVAANLEEFRNLYLSQEYLEARSPDAISHSTPAYPAGLTVREVEVIRLVANGLTNAQIAQKLVISTRTVNAHMRSIYNKLEISSRTAATRFAIDHHLL
jgi:predicted ATPase/DNA-binding CsgD family transcriptional regulator